MCTCVGAIRVHSEYHTIICTQCGIETEQSITPQLQYNSSMPLVLGYSRGARFKVLLDKLFEPLLHGRMNSTVLVELHRKPPGIFRNGMQILKWLSSLHVSNKAYQSAYSYLLFYNNEDVHPKPTPVKIHDVELEFVRLEFGFSRSKYRNSSFFSYNWLLHKILKIHKLEFYAQFVKRIKCARRFRRYEEMWSHIKTLNNDFEVPDRKKKNQTLKLVLPGGGLQFRLSQLSLPYQLIKTHLNKAYQTSSETSV